VLQVAAAAAKRASVRTWRHYSLVARLDNLRRLATQELLVGFANRYADELTGQRVAHKNYAAILETTHGASRGGPFDSNWLGYDAV